MKKILIIHPYDKTTHFSNRIKNHLNNNFSSNVHVFNIKPNNSSHDYCLEVVSRHPDDGLIIFLGHGSSGSLYGSKGDFYNRRAYVDERLILEYPESYYYNDNFINEKNINVFINKKIFCLACNSNSNISDYAIDNGTKAFLGFGDIPTSRGEFIEDSRLHKNCFINIDRLIYKVKTELNYIVKKSLYYAVNKNLDFGSLADLINLIADQRIASVVLDKHHPKEKYLIAEYIYNIKSSLKIKGDRDCKLIS